MTRMTFNEAIDFIMERLDVPPHERRATRDKVRGRVTYNLGSGNLPRVDVQTNDIDRDELIYWARTKWPGKFNNIPIRVGEQLASTANMGAASDELVLPPTLEACHEKLMEAHRALVLLRLINNSQAAHISRLKPLADQYELICEKNRASAKKPRDSG